MQTNYTFRSTVQSYSTRFLLNYFLLITFFLSGFVSFSQTTTVNITDANFREKLIQVSGISAGSDTNVIVDDISAITILDVSLVSSTPDNERIVDLTGIEAFTSLIELNCGWNLLTSLDVSANTALTSLKCFQNHQLTSLNVSQNTALTILYTATCPLLGNLDVSANTALRGLRCINNGLVSLDVSGNTALTELLCNDNPLLTSLNLKNGNNISLVTFNATGNTSLTCIQVDATTVSSVPSGWLKEVTTSYKEDCTSPADTEEPTITLTGANPQIITLGTTYTELGATATDNVDGDISTNIIIDATAVDTNVASNYSVTYNVSDTAGNSATEVIRTVTITADPTISPNTEPVGLPIITGPAVKGETLTLLTKDISDGDGLGVFRYQWQSAGNDGVYNDIGSESTSAEFVITTAQVGKTIRVILSYTDDKGTPENRISLPTMVVSSTLGNEDFKMTYISISPNPTTDILNITLSEKADYTLLNIRGQTLKKGVLDTGKNKINISFLAKGIYLLNIKTGKGSFTEKVVKN